MDCYNSVKYSALKESMVHKENWRCVFCFPLFHQSQRTVREYGWNKCHLEVKDILSLLLQYYLHLPPLGDPDPIPICRRANLPLPKSNMSGLLAGTGSHKGAFMLIKVLNTKITKIIILSLPIMTHCAQVLTAMSLNV